MGDEHYNFFSKSNIQKLSFLCSLTGTNDELVLLIIEDKWFETIVRIYILELASSKTSSTIHFNSHS
jgi:hypothetical protein